MRKELKKPEQFKEDYARKMNWFPGDEICPVCHAVVISQSDKVSIAAGETPKKSHLSDNRIVAS